MSSTPTVTFTVGAPPTDGNPASIIDAKCLQFHHVRLEAVEYLLRHPKAEVMEFDHCHVGHGGSGDDDTAVNETVHTLSLVDTSIYGTGLRYLLLQFPRLRTLTWERLVNDERDAWLDELGGALARYGRRLEHLELHNEPLASFSAPIGSLRKLRRLRTLEVDIELLIGYRKPSAWLLESQLNDEDMKLLEAEGYYDDYDDEDEDGGEPWSFLDLLPRSLEKLTFTVEWEKTDVHFNTYDKLGAKVEELLTSPAFARLHCVVGPDLAPVEKRMSAANEAENKTTARPWTLSRSGEPGAGSMLSRRPLGGGSGGSGDDASADNDVDSSSEDEESP